MNAVILFMITYVSIALVFSRYQKHGANFAEHRHQLSISYNLLHVVLNAHCINPIRADYYAVSKNKTRIWRKRETDHPKRRGTNLNV